MPRILRVSVQDAVCGGVVARRIHSIRTSLVQRRLIDLSSDHRSAWIDTHWKSDILSRCSSDLHHIG